MKTGRLTTDEEVIIVDMASRGRGAGTIARRLDRSASTINFAMHRLGVKSSLASRSTVYQRNGRTVRPFTPEEDAMILSARLGGSTWKAIAELLEQRTGYRRTAATIGMRLKMLANVEVPE